MSKNYYLVKISIEHFELTSESIHLVNAKDVKWAKSIALSYEIRGEIKDVGHGQISDSEGSFLYSFTSIQKVETLKEVETIKKYITSTHF